MTQELRVRAPRSSTLIAGKLTLFITLGLFILSLSAQDPPKIGLVLSGGGAKGLAHLGILKALEEAGITPDFITGTSMGSIMGGLYASGYSADSIKNIVLKADWDQLLTNKLKLHEVIYEEKEYYNRYINELNINGFKFELPKGLIEGQKLSMLLSNLTRPVMNIRDFSRLPISYACIGADIENGEKVVLNKGSLARSMRASMAIPTVFTPVMIDDRLLVDGGLVHNFPVEEAIEMGADYIIGVFVGTNLLKKEEMGSPVSVLTQSAFIHSAFDSEKQRQWVDLYIEPDMTGYAPGDFHRAAAIIAIGEKYGQLLVERFKAINDSLAALGRVNKRVIKPRSSDSIFIAQIKVIHNENVPSRFITDRLDIQENTTISVDQLEKGITNLYGTGYFTKILYEITDSPEGSALILDISESTEGKIRSALQYDTETKISLLVNLTYRNLLLHNSRIILEGEISENPLLDVNYLKYFGEKQKFGFHTGYYFRNLEVPEFDENVVTGLLEYNYNRYYASLLSSHRINRMLQLSYAFESAGLVPKVGSGLLAAVDKIKFSSHNLETRYDYNNLDDRYFPNRGDHYGAYLKYTAMAKTSIAITVADTLETIHLENENTGSLAVRFFYNMVRPLGNRMSFGMQNAFYLNLFNTDDTLYLSTGFLNDNYVGGFRKLAPNMHPFWGAEPSRYYAENLYFNGLWLRYEPVRNLFFQVNTQFYHPYYPLALVFPQLKERPYYFGGKNYLWGVGASVSYRSPAGPLSFTIAKGNTDAGMQFFLNLGYYLDRN